MRVAVFGAAGRMGTQVCQAVLGDPDCSLVAAVDPNIAAAAPLPPEVLTGTAPDVVEQAQADVAVDFTVAMSARRNAEWCAAHGVHDVIGTSGLGEEDLAALRATFADTANCIVAPNFAIGAVLMIKMAELAAPWFDTAEIIEMHHDGKADAPSGTAIHTAERMAAASGEWAPDPTRIDNLPEARGARSDSGIRIHSVRMRGMIASQEVILGTTGQSLAIRHDTFDRSSFMPGVLVAVKRVADLPGLTVGLDLVLGL
jgi:4-hydroxy-tetrahydrodipicolinate reductase